MNLRHLQQRVPLSTWLLVLLLPVNVASAYSPGSRWAQASALINDVLFVHGGKTDQFNQQSYTSAPNTNDLLYLPLSMPFAAAQPPWELVSSSTNMSTSQGPAVSWHTLSAFNKSGILLFGGQPGPNSPPVTVDGTDSAFLLDVFNRLEPVWTPEHLSWGDQPTRRIYHTSATSLSGTIFIIGGQLADGSGHAFSKHYIFDPQMLKFSPLPSDTGPPALYGHTSVMLADGRLFVFGGASDGSLVPFSTIWAVDTTKNSLIWVSLQVDASSMPAPRRAFAATAIGNDKILIQGGSDASLQVNFDDGWIVDVSKDPATWTRVDALTQVGPRRDHLAVSINGQVIFAFGYLNNGPAPASLQIYDTSSNSFVPSYVPPPPTATMTHTMPEPTATTIHGSGSPTISQSGGVHPTSTVEPGGSENNTGKKKTVTGVVLGATLGLLCALAAGVLIIIYSRRRRRMRDGNFVAMGGGKDDGNSSLRAGSVIPTATRYNEKAVPGPSGWAGGLVAAALGVAGTVGAVAKSRNARDTYQRRDMLADEDTREFGEWYNGRRRDGTSESSWSLNRILGGRFKSREPSVLSLRSHRLERTDPFSDGASLMYNEDSATPANEVSGRPHNRRQTSYFSTGSHSYADPFADPIREDRENEDDHGWHNSDEYEPTATAIAISRPPPSLPTIRTVLPVPLGVHPLSPLSEHTSKTSLHSTDHNASSQLHSSDNPFEVSSSRITSQTTVGPSSHITSNSSLGSPKSPPLGLPSIIPASSPPSGVRRSDSWWSRFYRTGFLDHRSSSARRSGALEIRDPNPLPALGPIRESMHSASGDGNSYIGINSKEASSGHPVVYAADPGKSLTSLRTADTEQIDRMAGTMDVVQRLRTHSRQTTGSISSGSSITTHGTGGDSNEQEEPNVFSSPLEMISTSARPLISPPPSDPPLSAPSKYEMMNRNQLSSSPPLLPLGSASQISGPALSPSPLSILSHSGAPSSSVGARVRNYERRTSQDQQPLPTNTKHREERSAKKERVTVNYGLVPRPSLFVANPDHRNSRSSDT